MHLEMGDSFSDGESGTRPGTGTAYGSKWGTENGPFFFVSVFLRFQSQQGSMVVQLPQKGWGNASVSLVQAWRRSDVSRFQLVLVPKSPIVIMWVLDKNLRCGAIPSWIHNRAIHHWAL